MAERIAFDAKTYRYGICGAMETLLVHKGVAAEALPGLAARLATKDVELRGCARTCAILDNAIPATDADWAEEFLGPILAVRVVDDIDDAIEHISRWGSQHTDAIVSNNHHKIERFLREVDHDARAPPHRRPRWDLRPGSHRAPASGVRGSNGLAARSGAARALPPDTAPATATALESAARQHDRAWHSGARWIRC